MPSVPVDDDVLESLDPVFPGLYLVDFVARLFEHALSVDWQISEQQKWGDVLLAAIVANIPPDLRIVVPIGLCPRVEVRQRVLERAEQHGLRDVRGAEAADVRGRSGCRGG